MFASRAPPVGSWRAHALICARKRVLLQLTALQHLAHKTWPHVCGRQSRRSQQCHCHGTPDTEHRYTKHSAAAGSPFPTLAAQAGHRWLRTPGAAHLDDNLALPRCALLPHLLRHPEGRAEALARLAEDAVAAVVDQLAGAEQVGAAAAAAIRSCVVRQAWHRARRKWLTSRCRPITISVGLGERPTLGCHGCRRQAWCGRRSCLPTRLRGCRPVAEANIGCAALGRTTSPQPPAAHACIQAPCFPVCIQAPHPAPCCCSARCFAAAMAAVSDARGWGRWWAREPLRRAAASERPCSSRPPLSQELPRSTPGSIHARQAAEPPGPRRQRLNTTSDWWWTDGVEWATSTPSAGQSGPQASHGGTAAPGLAARAATACRRSRDAEGTAAIVATWWCWRQ